MFGLWARLKNLFSTEPVTFFTNDARPRSPHWPEVRKSWLRRHSRCRACGGVVKLEVHHKTPYHLRPDLELDATNLITLCEKPAHNCHLIFGHCYNWDLCNPWVEQACDYWSQLVQTVRNGNVR